MIFCSFTLGCYGNEVGDTNYPSLFFASFLFQTSHIDKVYLAWKIPKRYPPIS